MTENSKARKREHISFLVTQCFNTLDSFGKSLNDSMRLHIEHLSEFTTDQLTAAFEQWVRTSPKVPAPSDIRDLILAAQPKPEHKQQFTSDARWTLVIYADDDKTVLDEYTHGHHPTPIALSSKYAGQNIIQRMKREQ